MKKSFLITIDTEGDNLWGWHPGDKITTENAKHLLRFQLLCDKYGFKPTYLTNYEMARDDFFADTFAEIQSDNRCEIGMHLHAFYSPPDDYKLVQREDGQFGQSYLIEYPYEVMESKIAYMTDYIAKRFGSRPISHRAGRWAMNDEYFKLLDKYGYLVDCSVTPFTDWSTHAGFSAGSGGSDYSRARYKAYKVPNTHLTELPMTIVKDHRFYKPEKFRLKSLGGSVYRAIKGDGALWMRPRMGNYEDMVWVSDYVFKSSAKYLMFMIHSSELAPDCNPRFRSAEDIDKLYSEMAKLFEHISKKYSGKTIREFIGK